MELNNACVINTGNILSLNDITKKSGRTPSEELIEAIKITLEEFRSSLTNTEGNRDVIYRPSDDLNAKIEEHSLSDLKFGLKVFMTNDSSKLLREAIDKGLATLNVPCVQNLVLQYNNLDSLDDLKGLKKLWEILEEYVKNEKIIQIGLADVSEATFRNIFEWATVKPSIIQINLVTCCTVPQTLQTFCKENDLQLLTHSDSDRIVPNVQELGALPPIKWILRFLVHIKCRGVLCSKGYLLGIGNN